MYKNFKLFSDEAKVLIFPSSRNLYPQEIEQLNREIPLFLAESFELDLGYQLKYKRFLIFYIEDNISFSADNHEELVNYILNLEKRLSISLLDKVNVCFKQGNHVQRKEMNEFKALIKNRGVSKKTIVFNNLITSKAELDHCWETPASESWISHLF